MEQITMLLRLVTDLARWLRLGFSRDATLCTLFLPVALPLVLVLSGCSAETSQEPLPPVAASVDQSVRPSGGSGGSDGGTGGQRFTQDVQTYGRCGVTAVE